MVANAFGRYRQNELVTASPGEILLALYDGMLRFSQQAREAMLAGHAKDKGLAIGRVMDIILELVRTLEHTRAPALCEKLEALYRYFLARLLQANTKRDVAILDEVTGHLSRLRNTWYLAVRGPSALSPNP